MADGSIKNIEDVVIFDKIMGAAGPNTVKAYDHWPLDGRDLIGINGNGPFKTPEHPLMTRVGWKAYNSETTKTEKPEIAHLMVNGNLEVGDEILMDDGSWTKVTSLEVFSGEPEQVVYNFYLDGDHTYYANGMLAHNRCDGDTGGDCK
jgi:intein/homing endonuclease